LKFFWLPPQSESTPGSGSTPRPTYREAVSLQGPASLLVFAAACRSSLERISQNDRAIAARRHTHRPCRLVRQDGEFASAAPASLLMKLIHLPPQAAGV